MATCGVWMSARRLVAVAVDDDGTLLEPVHSAPRDDEARWDLVASIEAHHGLDCLFVATRTLHASDALARIAVRRGGRVLIAPDELVGPACRLSGLVRASPRALALLLARMPLCRPFSERLVRLQLQLPLF
jgi:hypothetical protein